MDENERKEFLKFATELQQEGVGYKVRGWSNKSRAVAEWIPACVRVLRTLDGPTVDPTAAVRQLAVLHGTASLPDRAKDAFRSGDEVAKAIEVVVDALRTLLDDEAFEASIASYDPDAKHWARLQRDRRHERW